MSHRKPVESPRDLLEILRPGQPLMGLDLGSKTIGIALSDLSRSLATPRTTIRRTKFTKDVEILRQIITDDGVGAVIIGLPINMDGSEGPRCQSTRQFAANLQGAIDIDVAFWDERLSTVAVERVLIEADVSRKRRREVVDKMAAAFILQGALDFLAGA